MDSKYQNICSSCSRLTTQKYSTSFSLGIRMLHPSLRQPIYHIYGFVRFADEIVDTFQGYDQPSLLENFKKDTYQAIENKISLNPILQSFQHTVNTYNIDLQLIESFFQSMEMDLKVKEHSQESYQMYIVGSAEVVGLMCLYVFLEGDKKTFLYLKPYAERLGAAFQKVNFLRDLKHDNQNLKRKYFPDLIDNELTESIKQKIESEIDEDFKVAKVGIQKLPRKPKSGVLLAYLYFKTLHQKIKKIKPKTLMNSRVRISNGFKIIILLKVYVVRILR